MRILSHTKKETTLLFFILVWVPLVLCNHNHLPKTLICRMHLPAKSTYKHVEGTCLPMTHTSHILVQFRVWRRYMNRHKEAFVVLHFLMSISISLVPFDTLLISIFKHVVRHLLCWTSMKPRKHHPCWTNWQNLMAKTIVKKVWGLHNSINWFFIFIFIECELRDLETQVRCN